MINIDDKFKSADYLGGDVWKILLQETLEAIVGYEGSTPLGFASSNFDILINTRSGETIYPGPNEQKEDFKLFIEKKIIITYQLNNLIEIAKNHPFTDQWAIEKLARTLISYVIPLHSGYTFHEKTAKDILILFNENNKDFLEKTFLPYFSETFPMINAAEYLDAVKKSAQQVLHHDIATQTVEDPEKKLMSKNYLAHLLDSAYQVFTLKNQNKTQKKTIARLEKQVSSTTQKKPETKPEADPALQEALKKAHQDIISLQSGMATLAKKNRNLEKQLILAEKTEKKKPEQNLKKDKPIQIESVIASPPEVNDTSFSTAQTLSLLDESFSMKESIPTSEKNIDYTNAIARLHIHNDIALQLKMLLPRIFALYLKKWIFETADNPMNDDFEQFYLSVKNNLKLYQDDLKQPDIIATSKLFFHELTMPQTINAANIYCQTMSAYANARLHNDNNALLNFLIYLDNFNDPLFCLNKKVLSSPKRFDYYKTIILDCEQFISVLCKNETTSIQGLMKSTFSSCAAGLYCNTDNIEEKATAIFKKAGILHHYMLKNSHIFHDICKRYSFATNDTSIDENHLLLSDEEASFYRQLTTMIDDSQETNNAKSRLAETIEPAMTIKQINFVINTLAFKVKFNEGYRSWQSIIQSHIADIHQPKIADKALQSIFETFKTIFPDNKTLDYVYFHRFCLQEWSKQSTSKQTPKKLTLQDPIFTQLSFLLSQKFIKEVIQSKNKTKTIESGIAKSIQALENNPLFEDIEQNESQSILSYLFHAFASTSPTIHQPVINMIAAKLDPVPLETFFSTKPDLPPSFTSEQIKTMFTIFVASDMVDSTEKFKTFEQSLSILYKGYKKVHPDFIREFSPHIQRVFELKDDFTLQDASLLSLKINKLLSYFKKLSLLDKIDQEIISDTLMDFFIDLDKTPHSGFYTPDDPVSLRLTRIHMLLIQTNEFLHLDSFTKILPDRATEFAKQMIHISQLVKNIAESAAFHHAIVPKFLNIGKMPTQKPLQLTKGYLPSADQTKALTSVASAPKKTQ